MEIRYYRDPETGLPHIHEHGVTEAEAEWILAHPGEDDACTGNSRQALGQTVDGRYLRVVYVPDEEGGRGIRGDGLSAGRQATQSFSAATTETWTMNEQRFPPGWNEQRVKQLIAELDARTDDEWIAADEAAAANADDQAVITVPTALLPEIRRLLASHKSA